MTSVLEHPRPLMSERHGLDDLDGASFEAFYRKEYRSVLGLGYVLTGNRNMAEDLAQDAFAEAHRRWAHVARYDKPGAWVRRVLVNKSRSRLRRIVSETRALDVLGGRRAEVIELPERSEGVWTAVRALPRRQAQAIALRYWDGLSIGEIAEVLSCGSETVRTHLKRAKRTLATELAAEQGRPDAC